MIDDEEKQRRRHGARQSLAHLKLEGFELCDETLQITERYINGEITLEEHTQQLLAMPYKEPKQ